MLNISLWVTQVLLAAAFLAHGWFLLWPSADVMETMNAMFPRGFWIFLGVAEVLAGIGLIVPAVSRIQPWLVSAAAAGLTIVMIGATVLHIVRSEISSAVITAILLAMSAFVAYARWKVKPIEPRRVA